MPVMDGHLDEQGMPVLDVAVLPHARPITFGTLLYRATLDLLLVSRALGHRDVRSTQRYAHVEDRALARAVNRL